MAESQPIHTWRRASATGAELNARTPRPAKLDPVVERARSAARAARAPTGKAHEALLINVHLESAVNQREARRKQAAVRCELNKRLKGIPAEVNGETVMVTTVTTREILAALKAESDVVKVEAMAQRQLATGPRGSRHLSIADFIASQEAPTPGPGA